MSDCALVRRKELCFHDQKLHRAAQAIHLLELGARAGLVAQLTGMPRSAIKQLHLHIHGTPSPPGQTPFTDAWYVQTDLRMLHANVIWKFDCALKPAQLDPAARLIDTYTSYLGSVQSTELTINRAFFVPQLLLIGAWCMESCVRCAARFIGPPDHLSHVCPACRLRGVHRCDVCGEFLPQKRTGRKVRLCGHCKTGQDVPRRRRPESFPCKGF